MIKCNKNGSIEYEGTGLNLLTDTTCIIHEIYELMVKNFGEKIAKNMINHAVELAFYSEDDLKKDSRVKDVIRKTLNLSDDEREQILKEATKDE